MRKTKNVFRSDMSKFLNKKILCYGFFGEISYRKLKMGLSAIGVRVVLLKNVVEASGKFNFDHLWVPFFDECEDLKLQQGDLIKFEARVEKYRKGSKYQYVSYGLTEVNNVTPTKFIINY